MSSLDKYIDKLLQKPYRTDIGFEETYNFLTSERVGYTAKDNGGSHCHFKKAGFPTLTIKRATLKVYSIKQIIDALEEIGILGDDEK